jgi:glycosyltransferase involved in cell wall biosynthesis
VDTVAAAPAGGGRLTSRIAGGRIPPPPLAVLVFAHVPPPHHGQSYMVAQLLEELRARPGEVHAFHVDSRLSDRLEEVGRAGLGKVWRIVRYSWQAIWLRMRHGPMVFYYVPAPAKRGALLRDWLVMALCRPFFRERLVLHWHAVGLGEWLKHSAGPLTALISRRLLGAADLSLVLAQTVSADAGFLLPKQTRVLANGIPDPCPDFDAAVLPARLARRRDRQGTFRVLFLAHCTAEKGLYDALEGVFGAQRKLCAAGSPLRLTLTIAGQFLGREDEPAFRAACSRLSAEWTAPGPPPAVTCVGFVSGEAKDRLLRESDCLCFPTYYPNEVMPVSLIEALAYGLPIVATRWRAIPEMLPGESGSGCFLVDTCQSDQVAAALGEAGQTEAFAALRAHFLAHYRREVFGERFVALLTESFAAPPSHPRPSGA